MEHKEKITAKEGRVSHLPEKAPVDASGKEVLLSLKNVDITFGKSAQPLTTLSPKASITSTSLKMRRIA